MANDGYGSDLWKAVQSVTANSKDGVSAPVTANSRDGVDVPAITGRTSPSKGATSAKHSGTSLLKRLLEAIRPSR